LVELIKINEENWLDYAGLSVREDQKGYLSSNIGIIARGYAYRDSRAKVFGIAAGNTAVGLVMVKDMDEEPACYDLQQFMIDEKFQGKGYGMAALKLILEELGKERKYNCVEVCVKEQDVEALHLYEKIGFKDTGYIDEDAPDCLNLMYYFEDAGQAQQSEIDVKEIFDAEDKKRITRLILEALPDWFGIEESREEYIRDSVERPFFAAFCGDRPIGFICLKETGKETAELCVMGVLQEYHRKGVGRMLFEKLRETAKRLGYSFLQVKTVQMGRYEDYDATNRFYLSLGFKEFEVFPLLWDEWNPCQIYVMTL